MTTTADKSAMTGLPPDAPGVSLDEVFELLPAGVIALDRSLQVRYINPSGCRALGLAENDPEADRLVAALVADEAVQQALSDARQDGEERRIALFFEGKGGVVTEIGLGVVPQAAAKALRSPLGALLVFRALDVGRSLDQRMREIEHLAAIGRLAAGFAHEVRNPIAAIQGLAEGLVEELPADAPQVEYAQRILGLVGRVEALVRSCLDLGPRPAAQGSPIQPRTLVDVALRRSGMEGQVAVDIEPGVPGVVVDPLQGVECLCALLSNASEAATPPPPVRLSVRSSSPDRQRIVFEVADRGDGIPTSSMTRLFEPFFTSKPRSTGLGLTVARLVAVRNQGSLEVRRHAGETIFALSLPAVSAPDGRES